MRGVLPMRDMTSVRGVAAGRWRILPHPNRPRLTPMCGQFARGSMAAGHAHPPAPPRQLATLLPRQRDAEPVLRRHGIHATGDRIEVDADPGDGAAERAVRGRVVVADR